MEKKNRRFPQPSICAASNKSFGKLESKNVLATPAASWLQDAGLVRLPDGLRLYTSPF